MDIELTDTEVRVLGSLMEKELLTPEYYPLSLNALVNACNQKTSRSPVVNLSGEEVERAIDTMMEHRLVWRSEAGRVAKYEQRFSRSYGLVKTQAALLSILMLRGPQTAGELRSRTERMHAFADIDEVLEDLTALEAEEFVFRLERQPGSKEHRWTHLLSGAPAPDAAHASFVPDPDARSARITALEEEVRRLRFDVEELRRELRDLLD